MRKRDNKSGKEIINALFLVTQIGLSMIVCMGISIAIGIALDNYFGTEFCILIMLAIGIMASIRSMLVLTGKIYSDDNKSMEEHSEGGKKDS